MFILLATNLEDQYEFVVTENCPYCPRLLAKTKKEGDCYNQTVEEGDSQERTPLDLALARFNVILFKKAKFNIRGIWSMSRYTKASYLHEDVLTDQMYMSNETPKTTHCKHPAWSTRKMPGMMAMMSKVGFVSTRTAGYNESNYESKASISRKEERMLPYSLLIPYFHAVKTLTGLDVPLENLFRILEEKCKPMFSGDFKRLQHEGSFTSLTDDIINLTKNTKGVSIGKKKVLLIFLILS